MAELAEQLEADTHDNDQASEILQMMRRPMQDHCVRTSCSFK